MKSSRARPASALRREVFAYFGPRCVVTGDGAPELHHLDGDKGHTTFTNLLPVTGRLNKAIEWVGVPYRHSTPRPTPADLVPEWLRGHAASMFAKWEIGRAHGCARLAFYVARRLSRPPDELFLFACDAFYYARHRVSIPILEDMLRRDFLPLLRQADSLPPSLGALLLREFAGVFSENGFFGAAHALYELCRKFAAESVVVSDPIEMGMLLRRDAMAIGAQGERLAEAAAMLREAQSLGVHNENLALGIANSEAWFLLHEHPSVVAEQLEPHFIAYRHKVSRPEGLQPVAATAWNVAELATSYALALAMAPPRRYTDKKITEAIEFACAVLRKSGAQFFELHEDFRHDLDRQIRSPAWSAWPSQWRRSKLPSSLLDALTVCSGEVRRLVGS